MKIKEMKVGTMIAVIVLAGIILMSVFAPLIAPYDPLEVNIKNSLQQPSAQHWLGTDAIGRDLLSRVIYGGRQSIILAVVATALSMLVGLIIGVIAGYFGGVVDMVITSFSSIFQGLPGTSMMIVVAGMVPGIPGMIVAIVITSWVGFSRIVRGEVMKIKQEKFVEGLRGLGAGNLRIVLRHITPNLISNIIIIFTTRIARVILSVASLSFLGLGLQPPTPDWGVMINEARVHFRSNPLLIIAPGAFIIAISLSVNVIGDALRDKLDVHKDSLRDY
ncbi:ABC transporter permease [Bianquea renquensis]|jgi:oligopeptide ABC transporter, permease protein appC|nr:ABC transporter permease [Bianquea renquensis]